ncbi:acyltransferase family protein [Brucella sp. 10RB9214]|uniref:acyltransferase family protein n=1 Tax=unclassified Brucella TaxID=2632610 RepID=UPI000972DE12|nr:MULTISPECIES: acyltransferase [unclassified Brucella]APY13151.1 hypothetical protein BKD02_01515 [Brucella sp. 09RB8910]MRN46114.1 acyltransferase family protein [Brucella sp. 10RB9212]MRN49811.1 acyltransferase family protein [Brucella sp. 10RB9214]
MQKNSDIQILRAAAVLLVLYDHLTVLLYWGGSYRIVFDYAATWTGVDLFFCVSGFIIARGLLEKRREETTFSAFALQFWVKRAFRIFPAAWFWLAFTLVMSLLVGAEFGSLQANLGDGISIIGQYANLHFYNCAKGLAQCGVNGRYWSLALEEQFYLVAPFAIFFLPLRWLPYVFGAVVALQFGIKRDIWDPLWAFRTDAISLGVLIAFAEGGRLHRALRPYVMLVPRLAFPALIMLMVCVKPLTQASFSMGLVAMTAGVLVFAGSYNADRFKLPGILQSIGLYLGDRSYSLYLAHIPAYLSARHFLEWAGYQQQAIPSLILAGVLTLAFSEASYRYVENPFRKRGAVISARMATSRRSRLAAGA